MDQDTLSTHFIEAYDQYADEIYRFCLFKVSDQERAQDLVQDVFARYWQTLRKTPEITYPRALLFTIARNRVTDWYRKKKEDSLDALQEGGVEFTGQTGVDVERDAQYAEILKVIDELDEPSREAVLLRYTEGWSPAEIAALNNESANAVSVRLNRAIKKLQDRLHL
ncbi:MAG TPA: sigma-70 family RNA polymerase sigma factor [Candidatus Paceibacterota bacterium]|nr:sigma-70 family RNA polymerase sigma factor [Candidatus Paceibacterota bacterium]